MEMKKVSPSQRATLMQPPVRKCADLCLRYPTSLLLYYGATLEHLKNESMKSPCAECLPFYHPCVTPERPHTAPNKTLQNQNMMLQIVIASLLHSEHWSCQLLNIFKHLNSNQKNAPDLESYKSTWVLLDLELAQTDKGGEDRIKCEKLVLWRNKVLKNKQ